jgi:hypothetical protein
MLNNVSEITMELCLDWYPFCLQKCDAVPLFSFASSSMSGNDQHNRNAAFRPHLSRSEAHTSHTTLLPMPTTQVTPISEVATILSTRDRPPPTRY